MPSTSDHLLRSFKGDLRAPLPLHPLEKALIWVAAINVCSLPWMLGGMRDWAQFITLGLSLIALILALIPRHYAGSYIRTEAFTYYPHRKLVRWPLFWIGLVFFGYVLIQALNPAYEFATRVNGWTMLRVTHITWLPTGMRTPFAMMNTWRQMMIWGAPFLLACALWIGFTRRKSVITLLTAIVANATTLAIVGIVARATANGTILWLLEGQKNYAFSSFIYKNHAGSFFALAVGLCLALAVYHHGQAVRHQRRSSPAALFVFLAMVSCVAVLQSYSRAAILIVGAFLILFTLVAGIRLITGGTLARLPLLLGLFVIGLLSFGFIGTKLVNSEKTLDRIQALTDDQKTDFSVLSRQLAWQAGYEMATEQPTFGWGAGGFRFLFPKFQRKYPEITSAKWDRKKRLTFWEHAHNDYLQLLIETGRIGAGLIGLSAIVAAIGYFRAGGIRHIVAFTLAAALSITLAHAATDFPLQNPAILATFVVTFALALSLPTLDPRSKS